MVPSKFFHSFLFQQHDKDGGAEYISMTFRCLIDDILSKDAQLVFWNMNELLEDEWREVNFPCLSYDNRVVCTKYPHEHKNVDVYKFLWNDDCYSCVLCKTLFKQTGISGESHRGQSQQWGSQVSHEYPLLFQ